MIHSIVQGNDLFTQEQINAEQLISNALQCLETRLRYKTKTKFNSSTDACAYARLQLAQEQDEVFAVLFLTTQHQLIAFEKLFFGTINEITVYPRKIIKKVLEHNAAKIILTHNHPSQHCEPSSSDKKITEMLKSVLDIIDVKIIDHIVVSPQETYSFAAHGLL